MSRPRVALALLGVLAYLVAGSFACAVTWTHLGAAAYWVVFFVYALIGVWLVVLLKRAVRR